jgi:MFS family permease
MHINRVRTGRHGLSRVFTPTFLTAWVASFLFFISISAFYLLPLYIKSLNGSEVEIGLIMGAFNAIAIICQPVVGEWVDRIGRRPFMIFGVVLSVIVSFSFAFTHSFVVFFFLRLLQGVALSAFFVSNFTFIAELAPPARRGQAMGLFGISGLLAMSLAPFVGEQIIRGFGYQVFFLSITAIALTALLVTLRVPVPSSVPQREHPAPLTLLDRLMELPRLPMAIAFAFGLGNGTVFIFLPTYAQSIRIRSLGLFYVAYGSAALLVRMVGGGLADRFGRRQVIVPAMLMQAIGAGFLAMLVLMADSAWFPLLSLFFLAGVLTGGAHGFLYPALSALVVDQTPQDRRGRVVGMFSASVLVGNTVGSVLFGYIAHGLGYGLMFTLLAMALLAGFALSLRLHPTPRSHESPPLF